VIYFLKRKFFCLLVATGLFTLSLQSSAVIVLVETSLGDFQIELFDGEAPLTVENFLSYIEDNSYDDSFIHRNLTGFVIQGGVFNYTDNILGEIEPKPPIVNEFNRSNLRGTIAMAKRENAPNSATNSWFINIADNTDLDAQNGGFTVFGEVLGDGMSIVDAINNLPTYNAGGELSSLPLIDYSGSGEILSQNLVFTRFSIPAALNSLSDLQLTKSVNIQNPTLGSSVEFLVTVTNAGPDSATNIEALDLLPTGMAIPDGMVPAFSQGNYNATTGIWQIGTLPPGNHASLSIPAMPQQYASPECFVNSARINSFAGYDSLKANNSAIAAVYVGGVSSCTNLTMTVIPSIDLDPFFDLQCQDFLDFNIQITNSGPNIAQNVVLALTGNLSGVEQTTTSEVLFDQITPGETVKGLMSWPLSCRRPDQLATYNIVATTNTTISTDSKLDISGEIDAISRFTDTPPANIEIGSGGGSGGGSGCFIATAAYGSYMHPHVSTLRTFRDTVLMKTYLGREFVAYYYEYSPAIAAIIEENRFLRSTVRLLLTPVVYAVAYPVVAMFIFIAFGLILIFNKKA